MSRDLKQAIGRWWEALKSHHGGSDQSLADLIESRAWRAGARRVQPVDRKNVAAWRARGQFPPKDKALQEAVVRLMTEMERQDGPPEGVGPWADAGQLYQAWLNSRSVLEERPHARTVEANARKADRLDDVLVDDAERTVREAASPEGLRAGFWQGSWVTKGTTPPYVPRSVDPVLEERIRTMDTAGSGGLLVVVGPPKAGKTRALMEALGRTMPARRLWQINAVDGALDAVVEAVSTDGGREGLCAPEDAVVLIDDMQRHSFHTATGVNERTLKRAVASGLVIVATLHDDVLLEMQSYSSEHGRSLDRAELAIGASPVLLGMLEAARVDVPPQLTPEELSGMPEDLVTQDGLQDVPPRRLARLPELLAAVDHLHKRSLRGASDRDHPERFAILLAGIDAHYLYPAGATIGDLEPLCRWAFNHVHPTRHWDPHLFVRAFEWATSPLGGPGSSHAIFQPITLGDGLYGLFDPLVPLLIEGSWDPERLSPHLDHFTPEACLHAANRLNDAAQAIRWATRAAESGLPKAMQLLGFLHCEGEDWAESVYWLLKAVEIDEEESSLLTLGRAYFHWGRKDDAERWLLLAAEHYRPALMALAGLYRDAGDVEARLGWMLRAARAGLSEAALQLGEFYLDRGETDEGQRWLGTLAAKGLGETYRLSQLENEGEHRLWADATAAWDLRNAALLGHPDALEDLAARSEEAGDGDMAAAFRARVADPVDVIDLLGRGGMHYARGEKQEAKEWFSRAAEAGRPEAMLRLGFLLPVSEAEPWWRRAADLGDPLAMTLMGYIHLDRDEDEMAELRFLEAASEYSLPAIRRLASTAETPEVAEHWWRKGADCFDKDSMLGLAHHHWGSGEVEQAEHWYRKASVQDVAAAVPVAVILHYRGEIEQSGLWLDKAVDLEVPQALAVRGIWEWEANDQEAADASWAQLAELEEERGLADALRLVGEFLEPVEPDRAEMWFLAAQRVEEAASDPDQADEETWSHDHD